MQISLSLLNDLQLGENSHFSILISSNKEEKIILGVAKIKGTFLVRSLPSVPIGYLQKTLPNLKSTEFEFFSEVQHKIEPIIWTTDHDIYPLKDFSFPISLFLPLNIPPTTGSPDMAAMIKWNIVLEIFIKGSQFPINRNFPISIIFPTRPMELSNPLRDARSLFLRDGIINIDIMKEKQKEEEFYIVKKFEIELKDEIMYNLMLKYKRKPTKQDCIELILSNINGNSSMTDCHIMIQQAQLINKEVIYQSNVDSLNLQFTSPSMQYKGVNLSLRNCKTTNSTIYLDQKTFIILLFKGREGEEFEFKEEILIF